ncbi:MAG: non-homologous end-joining DNA ligase [Thermoleophilaceae bacterium]
MADKLRRYREKRDFGTTREPAGEAADAAAHNRFVIQEHHARRLHWDLRLEHDGALASWALPKGVPMDPKRNNLAVHTEDHPLEYLEFHGEIPEGEYGAGTMSIWDRGTYEEHKFRDDEVMITFHGERVQGKYVLFQTDGDQWLIHRMDPADREPLPEGVRPMLATLGKLPPDDDAWAYELKWDGVRALCRLEPAHIRLESRNGADITARYPELRGLAGGSTEALLDGEIVALDAEGKPSFERLQGRMHLASESAVRRAAKDVPVTYAIFDVLHLDGRSTAGLTYDERRELLEGMGLEGPAWRTPQNQVGRGSELLALTEAQGLEGIVAKRRDSRYEAGRRSSAWVKVKNVLSEDVVIGGWTSGEGGRRGRIGALLMGFREEGKLVYAGKVGTGFTEATLRDLAAKLEPLRRDTSPFNGRQPPKGSVFVEPELAARVEFREWTRTRTLRAPSFKGLREQRRPKLSNLDKVLYPATGFTKGQVIDYYERVGPVLVPHLAGRQLTLKRYPDGVDEEFFFEKRCPSHRPEWVRTDEAGFCIVDDLPTLLWVANLASLELHPSLAVGEEPTVIAFDLDPGAPAGLPECAAVALRLRDLFERLGMRCFPKTSGSKGIQVYVPLNSGASYDQTKPFAQAVARLLEDETPDLVVSRQKKELREGKVLVDWSQNDAHKTTVAVYSLRARERPTVSTPVTWEEVESGDLVHEAAGVLERVQRHGDTFAPVLDLRQELPSL